MLRRPKLFALLAYLLSASPRGFHRRDKLLFLFWPDQSEARGRHALRQALYDVRRMLGSVLVTRGPQEVGIAPGSIWCDAIAFEEALLKRDLATAVKLWRGDLLEGLSIRGVSSSFQDWLDGDRRRFRHNAARAACGLAEYAARDGDANSAVRWGRRAIEVAPLEEAVLHRVLAVYRQLGHRGAAENVYREFETRLRAELELEPSVETKSLIRSIRDMLVG